MIKIERLSSKEILLTKEKTDSWGNCSDKSLKERFQIEEEIKSHRFRDGNHIGSEILIYLI